MKFRFKKPDETRQCTLICRQCNAVKEDGTRCKNHVCIGVPKCWIHNRTIKGLKIKPSTIAGAGKGLFAITKPNHNKDAPVFKKDQVIAKYEGMAYEPDQFKEAGYGEYTAPYALTVGRGANRKILDAACYRSVASLANHKPRSRGANAKLTEQGNLTAVKNIYNGQEIFASYGPDYKFDEPTSYSTTHR